MKNVLEFTKRLFLVILELLYEIRCTVVVLIFLFYMLETYTEYKYKYAALVLCIMIYAAGMALRYFHKLYKDIERKDMVTDIKRYTYLDKNGNPSIRTEDLPEIIDILYRIEEGRNG